MTADPSSDPSLNSGEDSLEVRARRLIEADHPTRALELLGEGLPDDPGLLYLQALAYARSGNVSRGRRLVDRLLAGDLDDSVRAETLSLRGRLAKDAYRRASDPVERTSRATEAADWYSRAWTSTRSPYPGINAATMSLLAGRAAACREIAAAVVDVLAGGDDFWSRGTRGEALLLVGDVERSKDEYAEAVRLGADRDGDIGAMRLQLRLLADVLPDARTILSSVLSAGGIVTFSGHMIDHPDRSTARFPNDPRLVQAVRERIAARLDAVDARIAYGSVACGADLLFCEEMTKRPGAKLHVVLPFALEEFRGTSVDFGDETMSEWRRKCDEVLGRAEQVHYATRGSYLGDEALFGYANDFAQGLAVLHGSRLGIDPVAICVFEEGDAGGVGTAGFLEEWTAAGRPFEIVDLAETRKPFTDLVPRPRSAPPVDRPQRDVRREFRAMIFADVKNYSHVTDELAPDFVARFVNEVGQLIEDGPEDPLFQNTWGDGLFFVFETIEDCAEVALRLVEEVEEVDWSKLGLPADTTVRVAVHAGPVFRHLDAIIQRENFFGEHVNRAARIEPVTMPGCVFASEQFAATLAIRSGHLYTIEYVGVEELAKGYDRCPLYQLGRRR